MNKRKLTPKQQRFVDEYLITLNAADAARKAGYPARSANRVGSENLSKPLIAAAISKAQAKRSEATKIKADDVLRDIREVADVCMGRRSVTIKRVSEDENGQEIIKEEKITQFNASGAIKALETIGKHLGIFNNDSDSEDSNAIFIAGVRSFITSTKMLPRDQ